MTNSIDTFSYLSINKIADLTGVSIRTLQKRCKDKKYTCRITESVGRNGKKYEILLGSLEQNLQEKIFLNIQTNYLPNLLQEGGKFSLPCLTNVQSPSFSLENKISTSNLNFNGAVMPSSINSSFPSKKVIPQKAKDIALSKFNIVESWLDFRADKKDKKEADKLFLLAYNSLPNFTKQRKILGEISLKSIYNWSKTLKDNNNDYYSLINNYKYTGFYELKTTLTDDEKQEFIKLYYTDAQFDLLTAYKLIKYYHNKQGLEIKSEATYRRFANFIKKLHYDFTILSREGEKALKDKVAPFIKRDTSMLEVGDILVADGNKLDFMIKNPFTGKQARAIMVVFMDWASRDFLGYEIMFSENTQCIASALRNAIIRLGKMPKSVYMDNGRAFKSRFFIGNDKFDETEFRGIYEHLGIKKAFAKPYNGKSKIIERSFGSFVKSCPPAVSSYIGSSITKKPAHLLRNEKFHKEIHKNDKVPTLEQAKQIIEAWLDFYRSQLHPVIKDKTIGELFEQGKGSGVDIELLNELMMDEVIRKIDRTTVKLFDLEYTCKELYGISGKVKVKYSLSNLETVLIYSLKGDFIGKAELIKTYNAMAKYFGNVIDIYSVKQAQKAQNAFIKNTMKKTKLLTGNGKVFENIPWAQITDNSPDIKLIEDKKTASKPKFDPLEGFYERNSHLLKKKEGENNYGN